MAMRKVHVGLSAAHTRLLDRLAAKLGLDKSSTIRYCISRIAEQENLIARPGGTGTGNQAR